MRFVFTAETQSSQRNRTRHALPGMNVEIVIRTSAGSESRLQPDRAFSAGCSVPAGIPPAQAGTPGHSYPSCFFKLHLPDRAVPSQESRLQPDRAFSAGCPVPVGIQPAKAGTPGHSYPGGFFKLHLPDRAVPSQESRLQPDRAFSAGCPVPVGIQPAQAGTPGHSYPGGFFDFIKHDLRPKILLTIHCRSFVIFVVS
jgi:hypothetical protein